jgi:hypothetical protein
MEIPINRGDVYPRVMQILKKMLIIKKNVWQFHHFLGFLKIAESIFGAK